MADNNPFFISTEGTGITFGQIDDLVDFPHSGIIKALNQMSRGNFAVKGANNFNITQSSSDPIISVATGTYLRDGKQFTTTQAYTFNAAAFTATADNSYYLIVVDSSNVVRLRVPTATNRVAQFTLGDTIIALLEYSSTTSNGARRVQFFTTDKVSNDLSIGHDDSGYTESLSISSSAGDTTIENKVSDKDIIFKVNDNGVSTEAMRIDGATANVGIGTNAPTEKLHLSDADGTEPTILIENTGTAANEPEIVFIRSTGTGADSRDIGHIRFKADDTAGNPHNFASFLADSEDADSGTEDGRFIFFVTKGGTDSVEHLRISGSSGIIFNEGGADIDVRIEGDTDTHLFFAEAGEDKIGIGTNNPTAKLHVAGGAIVTGGLTIGAGSNEFTITESSDDITLANTVNDKDIDISVNDGGGTGRRAKFTANTHSNEVILKGIEEVIIVALSDETTNLAAGTAKASFHMPYAMFLSKVKASVNTAPTGSVLTVDINEAGASILGTKLTIDAGEFTSDTAATPFAFSGTSGADAALADNALITFDIDGVGSSATGKGLKVTLYGKKNVITMGVIIINSYAFGGVAPISDIYSKDDAGNGASGGGNSRFSKTIGGSPQHDQVLANPMPVTAGQAVTVGLNGNWTSTETSIAWSVITVDNGMGVVSGVSPTSGTSAGFDPIFTIGGGVTAGQQAIYTLRLAVTNSNGTVTKDWNFVIMVP